MLGLALPLANAPALHGRVVDAQTGAPLSGVTVSINAQTTRTSADGTFALTAAAPFTITASGESRGYVSFHGSFESTGDLTIRLSRPTTDERDALAQINRFRELHALAPLALDENLMESARFWAEQERHAGRIGHTCAALGNPRGCIEFNAYFHALPGAPQDWFCGQNAAFDSDPSWSDPDQGFEAEEHARGERGHFINLVSAKNWIGLGKADQPGVGTYFAMNVL